jgi:hypothetical protein
MMNTLAATHYLACSLHANGLGGTACAMESVTQNKLAPVQASGMHPNQYLLGPRLGSVNIPLLKLSAALFDLHPIRFFASGMLASWSHSE